MNPERHTKLAANTVVLLALVGLAFLGLSCSGDGGQASQQEPKKIAVLQLGTHPVIDAVVRSLDDHTRELFGDRVQVIKYNANFDINTLTTMARQMVASDATVLVGITTPASGQLIGANRGLKPLVFTFVSDPGQIGYKGPGSMKNITGLSDQVQYERTLDTIRMIMPNAKRVGYLLTRSENNAIVIHHEFAALAPSRGFEIITAEIGQVTDIRTAAETLAPRVDLFLFGGDNTIASGLGAMIAAASSHRIPVFACDEESVQNGAVCAYSVDYPAMGRRTAEVCAIVLGGADPGRIPLEIFVAEKLIVNKKAAQKVGLSLPQDLIKKASRVIE